MGKGSAPSPPPAPNPRRHCARIDVDQCRDGDQQCIPQQYEPEHARRLAALRRRPATTDWTDPYTGTNINIPTFTATQTLSPQQQAIQDQAQCRQIQFGGHGEHAERAPEQAAGQRDQPEQCAGRRRCQLHHRHSAGRNDVWRHWPAADDVLTRVVPPAPATSRALTVLPMTSVPTGRTCRTR